MNHALPGEASLEEATPDYSHILLPGRRVSMRIGSDVVTGAVDAVMPDNSSFWIWTDGGKGRRMISIDDVVGDLSPIF